MRWSAFTLRDLCWLILMSCTLLGWWCDHSRITRAWFDLAETSADSEMFQMDRTLSLQDAIEREGYMVVWGKDQIAVQLKKAPNE